MKLNKKSLMVAHATSKDITRYSLSGIKLESDGSTVATDGHLLIKYTPEETDSTDYPTIPGIAVTSESKLEGCLIDGQAALNLAKQLPKSRTFPVTDQSLVIDINASNGNGNLVAGYTDLETPTVQNIRKMEGDYPDYDKVIPNGKPALVIGMGVPQLEKIIKTLKALGANTLKLSFYDAESPMRIDAEAKDNGKETGFTTGKIIAAVMPRKLD